MQIKEPRINLLRYMQQGEVEKKNDFRFMLILGLAVLLLVGIMGGTWWAQGNKLQAMKTENQQLQQDVDQLTKTASTDKNTPEASNAREALLNILQSGQKVKSQQLEEIYQLTIPGVTIGKLDVKSDNSLTMSTYCNSQAKCIAFLEQLRELEYIEDVKVISFKRNPKTGEVSSNFNLIWGVK